MATSWPAQGDDARGFGPLGTSLRTGVEIRMAEQHQSLESHARECAGSAAEAAKRHAEEHTAAEIFSLGAQLRAELAALAAEVRSIDSRTTAAEVRLDQSEASGAAALRDREALWAELRREAAARSAEGAEAERRRAETEGSLCGQLRAAVEEAAAARATLFKQGDERVDRLAEQLLETLDVHSAELRHVDKRMCAIAEEAEAGRRLLDARLVEAEAAWRAVHQHAQQVERHAEAWNAARAEQAQALAADCRAHADAGVESRGKDLAEQLSQLNALLRDVKSEVDANVEALSGQVTDGLGVARAYTDRLNDEVRREIVDTNSGFHTSLQDHRSMLDADTQALHLKQADSQAQVERLVTAAEARVLTNANEQAEGRLSHVQRDLHGVKSLFSGQIEELQQAAQSQARLVAERAARWEERLGEAEGSASAALSKTAAALRADFEDAVRCEGRRLEAMVAVERERAARLEVRGGC